MRISTGMIYDSGLRSMQKTTSGLLKTQQQVAAGRRILSPSDDPVAAARALEVSQSQSINGSQATTRNNVKSTLGIIDGQLESATTLMQRLRELTVQAGDASLSDSDRKSIATELRARHQEMVALANSRDGNGAYLFGGYQTNSQPFSGSVENGVVYSGDDGARTLRVSNSRELAISNSGNDIFMKIRNGNGVFATGMQVDKSVNAKQVTFEGTSSLTVPSVDTGSLELRFWVDPQGGVTTPGRGVGSTSIPLTYTNGVDNQFIVNFDGGAPILVDLDPTGPVPPTTYADAQAVVAAIQAGIGANGTASIDANGHLVVTSATTGATSSVAFSGNAAAGLTGTPTYTNGIVSTAGQTFYDIADANGLSIFTGTASTTGVAGTYNHPFVSGQPISLYSPGSASVAPTDFGANLIFTGAPQTGDIFTLDRAATKLTVTAKTLAAAGARAVIDQGTVSDPTKWSQAGNGGDMEVRFWVDTQGIVATAGQSVGSAAIPPGVTVGAANQFNITLDGVGPTTVSMTAGTYATPAAFASQLQTDLNTALGGPGQATVSLDASNRLVVTSAATGSTSAVALTEGNGAMAAFFGAPTATAGITGTAGATYYDLVDATTGKSMFTGATSTAGGAGNTYSHAYTSGSAISLSSPGGGGAQTFDLGAAVTITGIPAGGDAFTVKADAAYYGNGYFVTAPKTATTQNKGGGVIGVGDVTDVTQWNHPANSRNLEVRFWKDASTTPAVLYYDLVDAETEKSLFNNATSTAGGTGNTFTHKFVAGDAIAFNGLSIPYAGPPATTITDFGITVSINGTPASGDAFKVQASQSASVFDTMAQLIDALESGAPSGTSGNTYLSNQLSSVLSNLDQIEDNFNTVRASIGSRLSEVDDLDAIGQNLDLQYSQTLSNLQDLDYADALTKLTKQQSELQAAQLSFTKISQLSLFNYLT